MDDVNILGDFYQKNTDKKIRKSIGQYYTPDFVVRYILKKTIGKVNIIDNPYISIIDISCGAGYFLTEAYDILKEKFKSNLEELREKYNEEMYEIKKDNQVSNIRGIEYWKEENIHYHILKHCIYGADKDNFAVQLTINGLLEKGSLNLAEEINIIQCDSLVRWEKDSIYEDKSEKQNRLKEFWNKKYDYVVGNPPYIGHKQLDKEYKEWLIEEYKNVFKDKSDLSFCFFERIIDILSPKGIVGIITSRYFMESPTGKQLRSYLVDNTNILEIVDFYGASIFKDIGVATSIFFFSHINPSNKEIKVNKLKDDGYRFHSSMDLEKLIKSNIFEKIQIKQTRLKEERWMLISQTALRIYNKIGKSTRYSLRDIAISFQGVITGCDKAFVLKSSEIDDYNIERSLIKPWIKNSNVERYSISEGDLSLIYSNLIQSEEEYPNSIDFIRNYRDKLENRRECKNGIRKWYELQWGRDNKMFDQPKIVFPYKSKNNRFALDYNSVYCSADVYSLIIKDDYKNKIPLEYLVGLLNSNIYEFYFKLFAKKMGKGMYDYYPNSILDLKIITEEIIDEIKERVDSIIALYSISEKQEKIDILEQEINRIIGDYFELSDEEYKIIDSIIQNR